MCGTRVLVINSTNGNGFSERGVTGRHFKLTTFLYIERNSRPLIDRNKCLCTGPSRKKRREDTFFHRYRVSRIFRIFWCNKRLQHLPCTLLLIRMHLYFPSVSFKHQKSISYADESSAGAAFQEFFRLARSEVQGKLWLVDIKYNFNLKIGGNSNERKWWKGLKC